MLRLKPRSDSTQRLWGFEIDIDPQPSLMSWGVDAEGNDTAWLWFEGLHDELRIESRSEVETLQEDPFDFILADRGGHKVPMVYPGELEGILAPYMGSGENNPGELMQEFLNEVKKKSDGLILNYLTVLVRYIKENLEHKERKDGMPLGPEETLACKTGACRDFAMLYIEACRRVGIAARFVSGYVWGYGAEQEHNLHAWAEVYLPGGGWRGYDPTLGLAVTDTHIAVASGPVAEKGSPVTGSYRRNNVGATLDYNIDISRVD